MQSRESCTRKETHICSRLASLAIVGELARRLYWFKNVRKSSVFPLFFIKFKILAVSAIIYTEHWEKLGPGIVLTSLEDINFTWATQTAVEPCAMPALFSVITIQPILKEVSGPLKFHSGVIWVLNLSREEGFGSHKTLSPFNFSLHGLMLASTRQRSPSVTYNIVVPSSNKCSVMGYKSQAAME